MRGSEGVRESGHNLLLVQTVIPEFFALLIFVRLIFVVIYYTRFQEAVKIHCCQNPLKINFRVFHFHGFLQP